MTYWFLTSGNSQRDYSTFSEASTKCYPPLVESPLCPPTPDQRNGSVELCNWLPDLDRGASEQRAVSNLRQRHRHLVPASGLLRGDKDNYMVAH